MNKTRLVQVDTIAALVCHLSFALMGHKFMQCSLAVLVLVGFPSRLNSISAHPSTV